MKHNKKNKPYTYLCILIIFCAITVVLLSPIIKASHYARPVNDDFSFSYLTHQALIDHTNILAEALREVQQIYFSWQGTYSAIFLFSLQPGIFGNYHCLVRCFSVYEYGLFGAIRIRGERAYAAAA